MEIDDKIVKRFQFDLEMGRFKRTEFKDVYGRTTNFIVYSFNFEEKKLGFLYYDTIFNCILTKLGYEHRSNLFAYRGSNKVAGILIDSTFNNKNYCYYDKYMCNFYKLHNNEVPDYIKELVKYGSYL